MFRLSLAMTIVSITTSVIDVYKKHHVITRRFAAMVSSVSYGIVGLISCKCLETKP
jgi:hypothetical protein